MNDYRELLLGCGHSLEKKLGPEGKPLQWQNLTTVDSNGNCGADIVVDLNTCSWQFAIEATMTDTFWGFDEIHAYEVLEHLGRQGDVESFFATFYSIWSLLKPGGKLYATTPSRYSGFLWGDPGHTRVILQESLVFLDREQYKKQIGKTAMSDYRSIWKGDFKIYASQDNHVMHVFCLEAVKPVRE